MGFMRLMLAITVLIFHAGFGGQGGPIAVYGFYVISGYLITRVYLEQYIYMSNGWLFFLINRILRIMPLFFISSFLAYLGILLASQIYNLDIKSIPVNGINYITSPIFSLSDFYSGLLPNPILKFYERPQLVVFFGWLSQFWTISIEFAFYAIAPLLLLARKNYGPKATCILLLISFSTYFYYSNLPNAIDIGLYFDIVYRNALPTIFFFVIGMMFYDLKNYCAIRIKPFDSAVLTLLLFILVLAGSKYLHSGLAPVNDFIMWQIIVVLGVIPPIFILERRTKYFFLLKKFDSFCGNISYGVYLNQGAVLPVYFAYRMSIKKIDYINGTSVFDYLILAITVIFLSLITFIFIEEPINKIRSAIKIKSSN